MTVSSEYKPVQARRGAKVHATSSRSWVKTACGRPCGGWLIWADKVPTCKRCLQIIIDDLA